MKKKLAQDNRETDALPTQAVVCGELFWSELQPINETF